MRRAAHCVRPVQRRWSINKKGRRFDTTHFLKRTRPIDPDRKRSHRRQDLSKSDKLEVVEALLEFCSPHHGWHVQTVRDFQRSHEYTRNGPLATVKNQAYRTLEKWLSEHRRDPTLLSELREFKRKFGKDRADAVKRWQSDYNSIRYGHAPILEKCLAWLRRERAKVGLDHGPGWLRLEAVRWLQSPFHFDVVRDLMNIREQRFWATSDISKAWITKMRVRATDGVYE